MSHRSKPFLLVVARDDETRLALAHELFGKRPDVQIVLDRRAHERRSGDVAPIAQVDRRQGERRSFDLSGELASAGWAWGRLAGRSRFVLPRLHSLAESPRSEKPRRSGSPQPDAPRGRQPSPTVLLGILIAAGALLRGYWAITHGALLEGNACAMARIAENLLAHGTYVGLYEGPELMYPPFFPMLLALGSLFIGSVPGAARLVPFLAGVLLVPVMFALARLVYGVRIALIAAALVTFHPVLVDLSGTPLSEGPYLLLMVSGLYFGLRSLDSGKWSDSVWSGVMLGLAYLTRPEALLSAAAILAVGLAADMGRPAFVQRFGRRALCLLAPIVALMAPYAAYVSAHAGTLRLEGKGLINYAFGERRNEGMSPFEAANGIGPDLSPEGPLLSPNHFVATTARIPSVRELPAFWIRSAQRNKVPLLQTLLVSPTLGSILGVALVTLGLFGRSWTRRRAWHESVLLTVGAAHLVLILGLHVVSFRYLLPVLPLLLLWISSGIDGAARWSVGTARPSTRLPHRRVHWAANSIRGVLIVAVLLLAVWGTRWGSLQEEDPETLAVRDVGTWLGAYRPGPKRIMTVDALIPYYSGGTYLPLPYAEAPLALEYVRQQRPDFIALIGAKRPLAPYLEQWGETGIPDPAARLIYRSGRGSPVDVAIYEWAGARP
jgi:4-amino-4-deoxy-L-arabinose transferase-like glycosyltransferase